MHEKLLGFLITLILLLAIIGLIIKYLDLFIVGCVILGIGCLIYFIYKKIS